MSFLLSIILMISTTTPNSDSCSYILIGEIFPGYRVIIMNLDEDEIVVEVGGTSLKMGGEILLLKKELSDDKELIAISGNGKSYIKKRKDRIYFIYDGKLGNREYKLKQVKYSKDIERIRLGIFSSHFYKMGEKSSKELKIEFEKFKQNPFSFFY